MSTIRIINDDEQDRAIDEVCHLVKWEAAIYMDYGYSYYHTSRSNMPVNYSELIDFMGSSKIVPVNETYSTDKILGELQDKFEFWTTVLHLQNKAKYSLSAKKRVCNIMLKQAENMKISNLAYQVLEALTLGVARYDFLHLAEHGAMEREDRFVSLCLTHGINFACIHRI